MKPDLADSVPLLFEKKTENSVKRDDFQILFYTLLFKLTRFPALMAEKLNF